MAKFEVLVLRAEPSAAIRMKPEGGSGPETLQHSSAPSRPVCVTKTPEGASGLSFYCIAASEADAGLCGSEEMRTGSDLPGSSGSPRLKLEGWKNETESE